MVLNPLRAAVPTCAGFYFLKKNYFFSAWVIHSFRFGDSYICELVGKLALSKIEKDFENKFGARNLSFILFAVRCTLL